jgi:hypothetical protein
MDKGFQNTLTCHMVHVSHTMSPMHVHHTGQVRLLIMVVALAIAISQAW